MFGYQLKKVAFALSLVMLFSGAFCERAEAVDKQDEFVKSLASLIRFAEHNLKLDKRTNELTSVERLRALKYSLELYGVTIPAGAKISADMKSMKIAKNIVKVMSKGQKEQVAPFIRTFVTSLQEVSVLPPPPAAKVQMSKKGLSENLQKG